MKVPVPPGIAVYVPSRCSGILKAQNESSVPSFISIHLLSPCRSSPSVAASPGMAPLFLASAGHCPPLSFPIQNVHLSAKYLPIHPRPHSLIAMSRVIPQRFPGAIAHPFPHILEYLTNGPLHPPSEPVVAGHHLLQRRHRLHNPFNLNLTHTVM